MPRFALLPLLLILGCSPTPPPALPSAPEPVVADGLPNLHRASADLWSGGTPEGEAGFASLKRLGVRTVISVDGTEPNVAVARKRGLRYVHLPVGYDGIPRGRALELARAVRDLPGPVYVHCHHGKHRGPTAAAAIRLCLDADFTPESAEAWMKRAGTDPHYRGLVELPRTLRRPTAAELDRVPLDFPAVAAIPDLTRSMVEIDGRWDKLKAAKDAGWPKPGETAGDALLLMEAYREVARLPVARSAGFARRRESAEAEAAKLEQALRKPDLAGANAAFLASKATCVRCHDECRDRAK